MPEKNKTLGESVYNALLNDIMSGNLSPGDKIAEASVAENYGISRTPVRDAMRQLANEGIIRIYPKRFAMVSEYSEQDIQEVGYMRLGMDRMAVRMAYQFGSLAGYEKLMAIADECLDAYHRGDEMMRTAKDTEFHTGLVEISKNHLLVKFQSEINLRVQFILTYYRQNAKSEESHLQQHCDLITALCDRKLDRALSLVDSHLVEFYNLDPRI